MNGILGALCILGLLVSAFLIMFGLPAGKRLLAWTLVLAVAVPLGLGLLNALLSDLGQVVGDVHAPGGAGLVVVGLLLILILVAFIRFVGHRRKLRSFLGERPTSLKRRVERE